MFAPTRILCGRSAKAITRNSKPTTKAGKYAAKYLKTTRKNEFAPPPQQQQQQPPSLPVIANSTSSSSSKWLDDIELKLKNLRSQDLKPKVATKLGKMLKKIGEGRLELLTGKEGYLSDARSRGVDMQAVAWGEMHGHVNNVHYNRWAESGRINWLNDFAKTAQSEYKSEWKTLLTPRGLGVILKSIKTEYKFPVSYPDQISIIHKITTKVNESSDRFFLEGLIFSEQHHRIAARTTEEIVIYDYLAGAKSTLKPFMVRALAHMYELQERRRMGVENEIQEMKDEIGEVDRWLAVQGREKALAARERERRELEEERK